MDLVLIITKHAKEKMVIHGISKEQIKRVIQYGAKVKQTEGYLSSYAYIKVAYRQVAENCYKIKTVFVK